MEHGTRESKENIIEKSIQGRGEGGVPGTRRTWVGGWDKIVCFLRFFRNCKYGGTFLPSGEAKRAFRAAKEGSEAARGHPAVTREPVAQGGGLAAAAGTVDNRDHAAGAGAFFAIARLFRYPELGFVMEALRRKRAAKKPAA